MRLYEVRMNNGYRDDKCICIYLIMIMMMVVGINESSRYHFSRHHTCQLNAINIRRQMTRGTFTIIFILFINYRIEFHL